MKKFVLKGLCNATCDYLKHGITKDAFIALQTPVRGAGIVISMSVCLSVCLYARISPELHVRSLPNVWCMLPTVVAQSTSGEGSEVCYVGLPCLHVH